MGKNFYKMMCIVWSIVAIISGFYAVMNGGAMAGENLSDPSTSYIAASFGIPGLIAILFGFCSSVDDITKLSKGLKEIK